MAGRAPQANTAPDRTRWPRRESWACQPDWRRPCPDLRRAALDGRQAPKRSKRTGASAVVGQGEASTRSGPGATQEDRSNCSSSSSLITTMACQPIDFVRGASFEHAMKLEPERQNAQSAKCASAPNKIDPALARSINHLDPTPNNTLSARLTLFGSRSLSQFRPQSTACWRQPGSGSRRLQIFAADQTGRDARLDDLLEYLDGNIPWWKHSARAARTPSDPG